MQHCDNTRLYPFRADSYSMLISFFAILFLIVVNGVFSGTEMALVTLRESQIEKLKKESKAGEAVAELANDPNRFLATIQVGITLAGFLASAVAAIAISDPIGEFVGSILQPIEGLATFSALVIVTLVLSYVTLVFGELVPKRVAMHRPEKWALLTAQPLLVLNSIFSPVVRLLSRSTDSVVGVFGVKPGEGPERINRQELRDMVLAHQAITDEHRSIMRGAFEVSERRIGKVVSPRQSVFSLRADMQCGEALLLLAGTEFSRAPVTEDDNLDSVVGVVHMRDLLNARKNKLVRNVMREALMYPESSLVLSVMQAMQQNRVIMVVVVNEYGGVSGIATLEDLVEEIVGEIYDDYDHIVTDAAVPQDGYLTLPGSFPIYDLHEVGVNVEDGPYATLAGFMLHHLNEIPDRAGQSFEYGGRSFNVSKMSSRRIEEVIVGPVDIDDPEPTHEAPADQ